MRFPSFVPTSVAYSVDLASGTVSGGNVPASPEFGPVGAVYVDPHRQLWIADSASNALSIVNASTNQIVASIGLPASPRSPVYDPTDDLVFVPLADGNISVVSAFNDTVSRTIDLGIGELFSAVYDASDGRVYVSDLNRSVVDVIGAANGTLLQRISVDAQPSMLTLAEDRSRLYVAAYGGDRLDVIDTRNDSVIDRVVVDHNPFQAAYDPVDGRVLVGAANGHNVTVLNATNDRVTADLSLNGSVGLVYDRIGGMVWTTVQYSPQVALVDPANLTIAGSVFAGHGPTGLAADPGTGRLAVVGMLSNQVTILDGAHRSWVTSFLTGLNPIRLGMTPSGGRLWAVDSYAGWVVPLDARTLTVASPLCNISRPGQPAADEARNELYVPSAANGTIQVLNGSTGAWLAGVAVGQGPDATEYNPANHRLYVADRGQREVSVVDTLSRTLVASIPVGTEPSAVATDPARSLLFVANYQSGNVTVVNLTTLKVVDAIPVGPHPQGLAVDPRDDRLFVGGEAQGTITVVNLSRMNQTWNLTEGSSIEALAYDPASGILYATDAGSATVIELNATSLARLGSVGVGAGPTPLLIDPATSSVVVANFAGGSLSILWTGDGSPLTLGGFGVSPSAVALGTSVQLEAIVQGGNGSLSFAFAGLPPGCTSLNRSTLSCTPAIDGNFTVRLWANDSTGASVTSNASFRVFGARPPSLTFFSVTPSTVDVGIPVTVLVGVADGTPPITLVFGGLPAGCGSANSTTLNCTPSVPGSYRVTVVATDGSGRSARGARMLGVVSLPTIPSVVTSPWILETGVPSTILGDVVNGTPPFAVRWTGLPSGCLETNTTAIQCTPTTAGENFVNIRATDQFGMIATGNFSVAVVASPRVVSIVASPPNVTIGRSLSLELNATGGVGWLTYSYAGLPSGCGLTNASRLSCRPTAVGSFRVSGIVVDSQGAGATGRLTVRVNAPPTISVFALTPNELTAGSPVTARVEASGGSGSLTYAYAGVPAGCMAGNATTWDCRPAAGFYNVTLTVSDSLGVSANASRSLQVDPGPPAPGGPTNTQWPVWLDAAAVSGAAVAVVVTYLLVQRRRASRN